MHDGAGLSDATANLPDGVNGQVSNPIFENLNYDLLSIGNHELYVSEIAYETFNQFSKVYGDRYLTSNVDILNPATNAFEPLGSKYRYFTTRMGLRVMSFGFLFDFTGNSNVSRVTRANESTTQQWFKDAVNYKDPIDLFVVIGHNPPRPTASTSTLGIVFNAIRSMRPDVPVQTFGGHTHVRDFVVYDDKSTGLESGRYCETLGWVSIDGVPGYKDKNVVAPKDFAHPTRPAVPVNSTATSNSTLRYSRRYLDWNRLTFEYHSNTSALGGTTPVKQRRGLPIRRRQTFDTPAGTAVTSDIYAQRQNLNLTTLYGCAPQSWCQNCAPFLSETNIFSLLTVALEQTVVNSSRATTPRMININTGTVRFDLTRGPFTYDDSFIVSPFPDTFQFIPDVPIEYATQILAFLNASPLFKRSEPQLSSNDFSFSSLTPSLSKREACPNPPAHFHHPHEKRSRPAGRIIRRQTGEPGAGETTAGYVTTDDFGNDGDDTVHTSIPFYPQPHYLQANASFPTDGSTPPTVDLVFLDYFAREVVRGLQSFGAQDVNAGSVQQYLPTDFTTNTYLVEYARQNPDWQRDVPNCPVL